MFVPLSLVIKFCHPYSDVTFHGCYCNFLPLSVHMCPQYMSLLIHSDSFFLFFRRSVVFNHTISLRPFRVCDFGVILELAAEALHIVSLSRTTCDNLSRSKRANIIYRSFKISCRPYRPVARSVTQPQDKHTHPPRARNLPRGWKTTQFYFEGKMSFKPVSIGAGANAGARSVLLGGATINPGGSLETLALAAKPSGVRGGSGRG